MVDMTGRSREAPPLVDMVDITGRSRLARLIDDEAREPGSVLAPDETDEIELPVERDVDAPSVDETDEPVCCARCE